MSINQMLHQPINLGAPVPNAIIAQPFALPGFPRVCSSCLLSLSSFSVVSHQESQLTARKPKAQSSMIEKDCRRYLPVDPTRRSPLTHPHHQSLESFEFLLFQLNHHRYQQYDDVRWKSKMCIINKNYIFTSLGVLSFSLLLRLLADCFVPIGIRTHNYGAPVHLNNVLKRLSAAHAHGWDHSQQQLCRWQMVVTFPNKLVCLGSFRRDRWMR